MRFPHRSTRLAAALGALVLAGCAHTAVPNQPAAPAPVPKAAAQAALPASVQAQRPSGGCAKPEYPRDALRAEASGTATISFLIGTDGSVRGAKVLRSSGNASLDQATIVALSKCRFKPATENGEPVEAWKPVQYIWALQ